MLAAATLENVLAAASAVLAAVTSLLAALTTAQRSRATRDAVQRAQEASPDAAMSALSLKDLGDYVYGTLGTIPIAEYAANPAARANIAQALERIERFVSEDDVTPAGEPEQTNALAWFAEGRRALDAGDLWRSLAQLRRGIEIALRTVARNRGIHVPEKAGAGRMLTVLREGGIPVEAADPLRYAVDVANRAVHGEDIPLGLAYEAFDAAERGLRFVQGLED